MKGELEFTIMSNSVMVTWLYLKSVVTDSHRKYSRAIPRIEMLSGLWSCLATRNISIALQEVNAAGCVSKCFEVA